MESSISSIGCHARSSSAACSALVTLESPCRAVSQREIRENPRSSVRSQNVLTSRALTANWRLATRRRPPLLLAPPRRRRLHASPDPLPHSPCGVSHSVSFPFGLPLFLSLSRSPSLSPVSSLPHPSPVESLTPLLHFTHTPLSHSPSTQPPPSPQYPLPTFCRSLPLSRCAPSPTFSDDPHRSLTPGGPLRARQPPSVLPPLHLSSPWPSLFPSLVPLSLSRSHSLHRALSLSLFSLLSSRRPRRFPLDPRPSPPRFDAVAAAVR